MKSTMGLYAFVRNVLVGHVRRLRLDLTHFLLTYVELLLSYRVMWLSQSEVKIAFIIARQE